ncbi:hypothetical protein CRD60_02015 [Bifidobacterium aemilianum]|uniref:MBG domain-containing protein n=1 Tax=Bifidobacterium aemilianum TaxID=2493120 RepID=A0A366KA73_9BIFI|nr:MBG domain-containing protein [Bifidobacterium aemilianum]RBP98640.1 hypothetical protein CRD60_02015 [Bifidobacterium aemilianum]
MSKQKVTYKFHLHKNKQSRIYGAQVHKPDPSGYTLTATDATTDQSAEITVIEESDLMLVDADDESKAHEDRVCDEHTYIVRLNEPGKTRILHLLHREDDFEMFAEDSSEDDFIIKPVSVQVIISGSEELTADGTDRSPAPLLLSGHGGPAKRQGHPICLGVNDLLTDSALARALGHYQVRLSDSGKAHVRQALAPNYVPADTGGYLSNARLTMVSQSMHVTALPLTGSGQGLMLALPVIGAIVTFMTCRSSRLQPR